MTGKRCLVCGNTYKNDPSVSLHRFTSIPARRAIWLKVFDLKEAGIKSYHRVCSRHFPNGDPNNDPVSTVGKRFASPIKKGPRYKRAKDREARRDLSKLSQSYHSCVTSQPASSSTSSSRSESESASEQPEQTAADGQCSNSPGLELSTDFEDPSDQSSLLPASGESSHYHQQTEVLVNTALLARIEYLEAENDRLKKEGSSAESARTHFRIEQIKHDDSLIKFYTGFISYRILLAFFTFLGPVVHKLNYWGSKKHQGSQVRKRHRKLDAENQLFMLLVKLRLNLKTRDLAFRFGLSPSQVSRYLTTWICFLYHHLKELDWMPSIEQVAGTLPCVFKDKFPTTFAIVDGSEVFIETPTDLHMQSSTWSQYKHHNTAKFLIACTPNGAISYVSPLYVGSISDVDLTRISGFLAKLENKRGISIMADRGFTVKDMLNEMGIDLNIPPFMQGRQQLPPDEIDTGRKIASLRIHVERAIGRIKNYRILISTIPLSMARLSNQIVCICAFLSNFLPALVPQPPKSFSEDEVDNYFQGLSDTEDELTSESENESD